MPFKSHNSFISDEIYIKKHCFFLHVYIQDSDWGNDGVLRFEPHALAVACIAFSRAHPTHLLSLSRDGSLRCMDVQKAVFDDVRILSKNHIFKVVRYIACMQKFLRA